LFRILAGVRGGPPIAKPRGLPEDFEVVDGEDHPISDLKFMNPHRSNRHKVKEPLVVWMGDHSHSWLTGEEMLKWYESTPEEEKENTAYFFEEVARLVAEHGQIRFVFGFDS
jgi:hypothetical protein